MLCYASSLVVYQVIDEGNEEEEEEAFILCKSTKQNEWQSTIHTVQKATGKA